MQSVRRKSARAVFHNNCSAKQVITEPSIHFSRMRAVSLVGTAAAAAAAGLLLIPAVGGSDAVETCSAADAKAGSCSMTENAVSGEMLLQHTSKSKRDSKPPAPKEDIAEADQSPAMAATQVANKKIAGTHRSANEIGLSADVSLADLRVNVTEDEGFASVSFEHLGKKFDHSLTFRSVYSKDATIIRHTESGEEQVDRASRPRTFVSRENGAWASITLSNEDGTLSGLFENNGHVVRVKPASTTKKGDDAETVARLLQGYTGKGPAYLVETVFDPSKEAPKAPGSVSALQEQNAAAGAEGTPEIAVDTEKLEGVSASEEQSFLSKIWAWAMGQSTWNGQKWTPGCYPGDDKLHVLKIAVFGDRELFTELGSKTLDEMESAVFESSFIYEVQMNLRLEIEYSKIYETNSGAHAFAAGCHQGDEKWMNKKLDLFVNAQGKSGVPKKGLNHLFTGCGNGRGVVGLAYVGTMCKTAYNTGLNQMHGGSRDYLIFAHEVGHNFGADHSFEEGQGKTGGIMDYGDGKLDGEYQFNTQYRKTQVCHEITTNVNRKSCGSNFVVEDHCTDDASYKDRHGYRCEHWRGHNCHKKWHGWWYYNDGNLESVRENCPVACQICS
eukprot:TRINITY_DN743_c0_g1_i1.p1 TRINITY_DN743_c0_g1~~TRINITY_DN743_c0_g1_i1.p1  ORF type:complete len:613 (-),score=125.37 TRINITY_DN743_c0_g1_i1:136-1974(-)